MNNTPLQNVLMAVTAGESPSDSSPSLGRLIRNHADLISRLRLAHVSEFEARYKLMESVSLPEDVEPVCHHELKRFSLLRVPHWSQSNRPDSLNKEVASIVRTISHLYATIFCNAPDGTVLPPFPPKIRVLCGRLVNQLKGDRLLRAEWTDPNDIPFYISAFQDFATERQSIQTGKRARTITTPWWTCQRRVQVKEDGQGNVPGECATFDGEILLDTCSRVRPSLLAISPSAAYTIDADACSSRRPPFQCLSVRYCSAGQFRFGLVVFRCPFRSD